MFPFDPQENITKPLIFFMISEGSCLKDTNKTDFPDKSKVISLVKNNK